MKKTLIITTGVILILLVLSVWMYLLFFGAPEDGDDIFANLGFGGAPITTETTTPTVTETEVLPTIDTKDALRQLTTRPVAGFGFAGTSSYLVRYAERGTGHIYEINTETGSEVRVSGTTIPQVVDAIFSSEGTSVTLVSESDTERKVFTGKITTDESNIDFLTLPQNTFSPYFIDETTLYYAISTEIGTDGYSIDIRDNSSSRIFSIPVRDIEIIWGDEIYVYNKPSALAPGALYQVNTFLNPVTPQSFGFIGGVNGTYYFGSTNSVDGMNSYTIDRATDEQTPLAINYIPEKCAHFQHDNKKMWCALPFTQLSNTFVEDWYKGTIFSEDVLWEVDIDDGSATLEINFFAKVGRYIDVDQMIVSDDGIIPVFKNKRDGTLWLYDSSIE